MGNESGSGRVTMKAIAEKAGLSISTVSLALRNDPQIAEATRLRIVRLARELGYTQNPVIAQLMSELRNSRTVGHRKSIGLLNAHPQVGRLSEHVDLPFVAEGCRRRAEASGFRCEEFWLNEPDMNARVLNRLLAEKSIRGVIVIGVRDDSDVLTRYVTTWAAHATVVAGWRPVEVRLSHCSTDFFLLVRDAFQRLIELGYRRPALVVDERRDKLLDGRLTAGMWSVQQRLPERDRVAPFLACGAAEMDPGHFAAWFREAGPDALVTQHRREVCAWLADLQVRVPEDVGLVALDRARNSEGWACMDQRGDLLGERAVDLLAAALNHSETGVPTVQLAATIAGAWVSGDSVMDRGRGTVARTSGE